MIFSVNFKGQNIEEYIEAYRGVGGGFEWEIS
jgi:hypothetical protein